MEFYYNDQLAICMCDHLSQTNHSTTFPKNGMQHGEPSSLQLLLELLKQVTQYLTTSSISDTMFGQYTLSFARN